MPKTVSVYIKEDKGDFTLYSYHFFLPSGARFSDGGFSTLTDAETFARCAVRSIPAYKEASVEFVAAE